jgi:hypothetical protein
LIYQFFMVNPSKILVVLHNFTPNAMVNAINIYNTNPLHFGKNVGI